VPSRVPNHLALIAVCAIALTGCGGGDEPPQFQGVPAAEQDPGPIHVHGLGVDARTETLFIATHTGLWQLPKGATRARRVGDRRQDTMGFTAAEPGVFLGSGHPDLREDLPPLLGLIRSTDDGRSWQPVSLLGEVDFHVLKTAGDRIYGFDATGGTLRVSNDRGRTWVKNTVPEPLVDLVVDPTDADHVVASGGAALYESLDRGATWRTLNGVPGYLAWPRQGRLYRIDVEGRAAVTTSADREFRPLGSIGGTPEAFLAAGGELYAAADGVGIKQSSDDGRSWTLRYRP